MLGRPFDLLAVFRKRKASARTERTPANVSSGPLTEAQWAKLREPEREQDRVLSNAARRWLQSLPARVRPGELPARYPRLANRLALCWDDAMLCERLFDDLMIGRRSKRKGFPPAVGAELLRLRDFSTYQRKIDEKTDHWRAQALADR